MLEKKHENEQDKEPHDYLHSLSETRKQNRLHPAS